MELLQYYDTPYYFGPLGTSLTGIVPGAMPLATVDLYKEQQRDPEQETDLRSANEVQGYYLRARGGNTGHVADFILDLDDWTMNQIVIDTHKWLPGRKTLIPTQRVQRISWAESRVVVDLTIDEITSAPDFDPDAILDNEPESEFNGHSVS